MKKATINDIIRMAEENKKRINNIFKLQEQLKNEIEHLSAKNSWIYDYAKRIKNKK